MWETDAAAESVVEYGSTTAMENTATGSSEEIWDGHFVHEVQLTGLERFTTYYYRVKSGPAQAGPFVFKTPPFATDEQDFRFVAMSDMQKDNSNPNKFSEVVQEGVVRYLSEQYGGGTSDQIGLVLIPGDLVVNGLDYGSWKSDFFDPAHPLFTGVPFYPVLGNHEINTGFYFSYFHLPDNGPEGLEEHCWHKDYSNTRFIGLDSNFPFNTEEQIDWLQTVLDDTCENPDIDFVFAELHHPHKSELWVPGETDFTGLVIERLENFTEQCGKPSIHFFGHTHGYSRGQSQDHKHLWVNVATAGGSIDRWGEFQQADYDMFSKSQDEWGFVEVDVEAGDDPKFTLRRVSRGNEDTPRDNEITDVITVTKELNKPTTPNSLYPINQEVPIDCVILTANGFSTGISSEHGAAQWQVSTDCTDFSSPVAESWKQHENWFFNEDTQAGDDLTDEKIQGLEAGQDYCWRVRYRDRQLNWSDWSEPASFSTTASNNTNLLQNPGAEDGEIGWQALEGSIEILTDGECDGISPYQGDYYFAVGGICNDAAFGEASQFVDLSQYADQIDAGNFIVSYGGYLSNFNGSDIPDMMLRFWDAEEQLIGITEAISSTNSSWTLVESSGPILAGTRKVEVLLHGTRINGLDNDSYFDNLFFRIGGAESDCDNLPISIQEAKQDKLLFSPNPALDGTMLELPNGNLGLMDVQVRNQLGQLVLEYKAESGSSLYIDRGDLSAGIYQVMVKQNGLPMANSKLIFQ